MGDYADDAVDRDLNSMFDYDWDDPEDDLPVGRPIRRGPRAAPGSPLAKARMAAHRAFDPIWQNGEMSRNEAYRWLSEQMGVRLKDCHMVLFDVHACQRVVSLCTARRFRREAGLDFV